MSDYDGRKPEPPYATDTDELEQEIKDQQEQLEQKNKANAELVKALRGAASEITRCNSEADKHWYESHYRAIADKYNQRIKEK